MKSTGKRIIERILAIVVILTMTMADFCFVGSNVITYAIDAVQINNQNVVFNVSYPDTTTIDEDDLKLEIGLGIKNDGYLEDGKIELGEKSNFKFKNEINSNYISKIEDKTIYLKQINEGDNITLQVGIEFVNKEEIDTNYLSMASILNLSGYYVNSKNADRDKKEKIEGTAQVVINWKSPNEIASELRLDLLTNAIYSVDEANKRIVQALVTSKIVNNSYPAKNTNIELEIPNSPERVTVHKRTTEATNGDEENLTYEYKDGKLTINAQNGKDNKISWTKNSKDVFVVTIQYPETAEVTNMKLLANTIITTYDNKELKQNAELSVDNEREAAISIEKIEKQSSIGKGKLYTGEERTFTTTTNLYVDYSKVADSIEIVENKPTFIAENGEKDATIIYTQTTINKNSFVTMFGNEGTITILDQVGNVLATINKETETDENGNIVVKYANEITTLKFATSIPQTNGVLKLINEKKILKTGFSRNDIKELKQIKDSGKVTYTKNDEVKKTLDAITTVDLKETESKANLTIEPITLTTSQDKKNLKITAILETNNETKDLYKNPELRITLPEQITSIKATAQLQYGNGLTLKDFNIDNRVITVKLDGEQKSYEGEAVKGATVLIDAEVGIDKLATNSKENIILNYTNENATIYADNGEEKVQIQIAAENSMILTNDIDEYNVFTLGNEGEKQVAIGTGKDAKKATIVMRIANNEDTEISNVAIVGKIANISGRIERTSGIRTSVNDSKVYYTTQDNPTADLSNFSNGWSTTPSKDAKNYLVLINSIKKGDRIRLSYDISIASNLGYNLITETGYKINYINTLTGSTKQAASTILVLTTGAVAEFKSTLKAQVGGTELKDGDVVKAGEIIKYTGTVSNTGREKAENVIISATIPENTTLVETNSNYANTSRMGDETGEVQTYLTEVNHPLTSNVTINANETKTYTYMVKVDSNLNETKEVSSNITANYQNKQVTSSTIANRFDASAFEVSVLPMSNREEVFTGYNYEYGIQIKNLTDNDQKNVGVTIKLNELLQAKNISYCYDDGSEINTVDGTTFTINSIKKNGTIIILLDAFVGATTGETTNAEVSAIVNDSTGNTYRSNVLSEKVTGAVIESNLSATTNSKNKNGYVYAGDEIEYTIKLKNVGKSATNDLVVEDQFSDYLDLESVKLNGQDVEYTTRAEFGEEVQHDTIVIKKQLQKGEQAIITIKAKVNENISNYSVSKITNKVIVYDTIKVSETNEQTFYIEGEANLDDLDDPSDVQDPENPSSKTDKETKKYVISGTVWFDKDKNGSRDSGEELLSGTKVYAINVSDNKIVTDSNGVEITATTNDEGFYTLSLPEGKYIVAFEYDTEKYMVTAYHTEGVNSDKNSDAVKATRTVNGEQRTLAFTDSMELNEPIGNIDLGLTEAKVFSLELQKVISKMIVTNSEGTKTYNYEDTNLAKVEIAGRNLNNSSVVIEYKIKVTNKGEVAGYAKSIVDYIPSSLTFNSSLNRDWYRDGQNIYTSALANTKIEPGETREVTLILTKKMTESNTGLTNNKAEIQSAYNSLGAPNTATSLTENNTDASREIKNSADAIIGVKTGAAISYVVLTLTVIIAICGAAYLLYKKVLIHRIKI